ncbi:FtsX-like permease family protein [Spongiimicrobium salis]|uniref:FtsX-like permease family protein n=1 Tax=Spongiimicrobium salis TaxID=1667022 RepID=UPI00374CAC0B
MLKNHFKIAWRNLLKNKGYSIINIGGLAIGLACFLMIVMFIQNELSYDRYHENSNRVYRVLHHLNENDYKEAWVWGNAPVGPALKEDFSEVLETVQFSGREDVLLTNGDLTFQEGNCFYVTPSVFDVFTWNMISGDPKTALEAPYSIVLTESTAKKYFGDEDPMGKTLSGTSVRADDGDYTVTGIIKDIPSNSHFGFDVLVSMSTFYQARPSIFDSWGYVDFYTYFLVPENFDPIAFQAKIPAFLEKRLPEENKQFHYDVSFEALEDAYLNSTAARQPGVTGNASNIYIFGIIGLFILVIASINFMNLATARSMERAKEVGVRKVIGAQKRGLISQFLGESLTMVLIAAILGVAVVVICLPWMREITGKTFQLEHIFTTSNLLLYLGTALITAFLSGSYPAMVLSNFRPATVLKGVFKTSKNGVTLRKALVIFQFSLSIALIAGTAIVYFQMDYMLNRDLGFDREQQLVIDFNYDFQVRNRLETIKSEFEKNGSISSVSASRTVPGAHFPGAGTQIQIPNGEMDFFDISLYEVDVDFIPHFKMEMVAGRPYSRDFAIDTIGSLVVNEAAVKHFGYASPEEIIGKRFEQWGKEGTIIGVVKDFNFLSLHQEVEPLSLRLEPSSSRYLSLRIQSDNLPATISEIREKWATLAPHRPFLYSFLDDSFNTQYEADFRFKKLFTLFSFLAIFIACLGLLGLATYSAMQRTKEIGIRKVLGAEAGSIVRLLSKDFIKLVLIAMFIATPLSWYAMNNWLEVYAYKVTISWWIFALASIIAITIAILTVSFHAIKAAVANPVKSLRTE